MANRPVNLTAPYYLWNTLNQQSLSFGMIEGLFTYPAPVVDGFFWSGKPRLGDNYTYPAALKKLITEGYPKDLLPPQFLPMESRNPLLGPCRKVAENPETKLFCGIPGAFGRKLSWYRKKIRQLYELYPVKVLFLLHYRP